MTDQGRTVTDEPAAPVVVHSGIYVLYATPEGGRHLVYKPDGEDVDQHVPDIPAEALPLVQSFLNQGLPPAVLALLQGKASPMKILGLMRSAANGGEDGNGEPAAVGRPADHP
jgi:hypothetical protein